MDHIPASFSITADQFLKIHSWSKLLPEAEGGGRFTYMFTPTSLGVVITVRDNITGAEINVTDYESW